MDRHLKFKTPKNEQVKKVRAQLKSEYEDRLTRLEDITPDDYGREVHARAPEHYRHILALMTRLNQIYRDHRAIHTKKRV